jgi:hypothetical protein
VVGVNTTRLLSRAVAALAIGGVLGGGAAAGFGIASAVSGPTSAGTSASTTAANPAETSASTSAGAATGTKPNHPKAGRYPRIRALLASRVEHGELVLKGRNGTAVTMDVQRGQVTAVSVTSISLRSDDGYTVTYAVGAGTKVRLDGTPKAIGDVKVGGTAGVLATKNGDTMTATQVSARS